MKVDICIPTTRGIPPHLRANWERALPVCHLLVDDTTRPLTQARHRLIQEVDTEWFVFVDDDVQLCEGWFDRLAAYTRRSDIGALEGVTLYAGLGEKWLRGLNRHQRAREVRLGGRGWLLDTLIRTTAVRDWAPSRRDLVTWEDYELTQHVLRKGLRWIRSANSYCYHHVSWSKVWRSGVWRGGGFRKMNSRVDVMRYAIKLLAVALKGIAYPSTVNLFTAYQNLAILEGLLR